MAVTRVPLYGLIRQLSLPRAEISWTTFCVSRRYSAYLYLYYGGWATPPSQKGYIRPIFIHNFLFEWVDKINILSLTGATVL